MTEERRNRESLEAIGFKIQPRPMTYPNGVTWYEATLEHAGNVRAFMVRLDEPDGDDPQLYEIGTSDDYSLAQAHAVFAQPIHTHPAELVTIPAKRTRDRNLFDTDDDVQR